MESSGGRSRRWLIRPQALITKARHEDDRGELMLKMRQNAVSCCTQGPSDTQPGGGGLLTKESQHLATVIQLNDVYM